MAPLDVAVGGDEDARAHVEAATLLLLGARGYTHAARGADALPALAEAYEASAPAGRAAPTLQHTALRVVWMADGGAPLSPAARGPCVVVYAPWGDGGGGGGSASAARAGFNVAHARELLAFCRAYAIGAVVFVTPVALNRPAFKVSSRAMAELAALRVHVIPEDQLIPPWETRRWRPVRRIGGAELARLARRVGGASAERAVMDAAAALAAAAAKRTGAGAEDEASAPCERRSGDAMRAMRETLRVPTVYASDRLCVYFDFRPGDVLCVTKQYACLQPYESFELVV